ncbi:MAG TPA: histidine--tRNA ligase [Mycobacteriales bacterium]|jgi:histidyl-tRNA synthetase|nr:histidine--tRNA ligase [Mycobacteriales bacterium]
MEFTAPKGTYDVLPERSGQRSRAIEALLAPAVRAGYRLVETPVFEDTGVFLRVGEATDIVTKEMYTFADKGGRSLTLRPEGTAGVMRAAVEHHVDRGALPWKVRYAGPMFRYERPQAGRTRQFFQVGIEALGVDDPAIDAEVVALGARAFEEAGLPNVTLLLNSMGDEACRPAYIETLRSYLRSQAARLCGECHGRTETNPLRALDCKRPDCQAALGLAPAITDHLCVPCKEHYAEVRALLGAIGVAWTEAPRLVRGLDYYRRTTFEFQHSGLGAQNAVGGGGRYDGLSESLGGPALPGIGWAFGVERILLALEAEQVESEGRAVCEVFVIPLGAAAKAPVVGIVDELRQAGVHADMAFGAKGMKGAMKAADRSGAQVTLIVGERDLAEGVAQLKHMDTGEQYAVPLSSAAAEAAAAAERDQVADDLAPTDLTPEEEAE